MIQAMASRGRKPKPAGQALNRNPLVHQWVEVEDEPCTDGPSLPATRRAGTLWPDGIGEKWDAWGSMPHAKLWKASDWQFALDALELAAQFYDGGPVALATELRNREKVLGTTLDFRRDLRIRYTEPGASDAPAGVTQLDSYRDL
jgi:hypothetical protein